MHVTFNDTGISAYSIPKLVFKYHRINDYLVNLIQNSELWFSKPALLNDPYDCSHLIYDIENTPEEIEEFFTMYHKQMNPGVEIDEKRMKTIKLNSNKECLAAYVKMVSSAIPNTVGVACFSTVNDNMLMWSHYADGHKGVCLTFDYEMLLQSTQSQSIEVEYSDEQLPFNIVREKIASKSNPLKFQYILDKKMFGTKTSAWNYENEFRLLNFNPGIVKFNSKALREIIFGVNIDKPNSEKIINLISEIGRTDIEVKQAIKVNEKLVVKIVTQQWQAVKNAYDNISKRLTEIQIPAPINEEVTSVVNTNLEGIPKYYDKKNIATPIIDLDTMRARYDGASKQQKKILSCIKELYEMGIANERNEIQIEKIQQFAQKAHDLNLTVDNLNKTLQWIINNDFATIKSNRLCPEKVYLDLIIESNASLIKVIENGLNTFGKEGINFSRLIFNAPNANEAWSIVNFMKSQNISPTIDNYNQLIAKLTDFEESFNLYKNLLSEGIEEDNHTFYLLIDSAIRNKILLCDHTIFLCKRACSHFEKISQIDSKDRHVFYFWGRALCELACEKSDESLFKLAIEKLQTAITLKSDFYAAYLPLADCLHIYAMLHEADDQILQEAFDNYRLAVNFIEQQRDVFYGWGSALARLSNSKNKKLFSDSFNQFFEAITSHSNEYFVYYNRGVALFQLIVNENIEESVLLIVCRLNELALALNPDMHQAHFNYGVALAALASITDRKEHYFELSIKSYIQSIRIKPDKYEAYVNCSIALQNLASIKGNDESLLKEAKDKMTAAQKLRPDLVDELDNILSLVCLENNQEQVTH